MRRPSQPSPVRSRRPGPTVSARLAVRPGPARSSVPEPDPESPVSQAPVRRTGWRGLDVVRTAVVVATAVFALAGIGSPLLGLRVFADTGSLATFSGYRDVLAGTQVHTDGLRDQVDAQLPN